MVLPARTWLRDILRPFIQDPYRIGSRPPTWPSIVRGISELLPTLRSMWDNLNVFRLAGVTDSFGSGPKREICRRLAIRKLQLRVGRIASNLILVRQSICLRYSKP